MKGAQGRRGAGLGDFARRASGLLVPKPKVVDPLVEELRSFQRRQEPGVPQPAVPARKLKYRKADRQLHKAKLTKKRRAANKRARRARKVNRV